MSIYLSLILLLLLFCYYQIKYKENFLDNSYYSGRHTRNMSYDLRGEAYFPNIIKFYLY